MSVWVIIVGIGVAVFSTNLIWALYSLVLMTFYDEFNPPWEDIAFKYFTVTLIVCIISALIGVTGAGIELCLI